MHINKFVNGCTKEMLSQIHVTVSSLRSLMHVEVMKPPCGSRAEQGILEGLKPDVKTWQSYSLGSNSGSSKPWVLSSRALAA